jgi:hypothetical protein
MLCNFFFKDSHLHIEPILAIGFNFYFPLFSNIASFILILIAKVNLGDSEVKVNFCMIFVNWNRQSSIQIKSVHSRAKTLFQLVCHLLREPSIGQYKNYANTN